MTEKSIIELVLEEVFSRFSYIRNELTEDIAKETISLTEQKCKDKMNRIIDDMQNPYPEDIFIEPDGATKEQVVEIFRKYKLSLDGYNGSLGRLVWNNFRDDIKKRLNE